MTDPRSGFPFYDDFDDNKQFYQLMFNPGNAVQARELTQIQSTIQNQIAKFGKSIYREGSMVLPGASAINIQYPFVKLQPTFNTSTINLANFAGKTIIGLTSGTIATVLQTVPTDGIDPDTLYVQYVSGTSAQSFTASISNGINIVSSISISSNQFVIGALIIGTGIPPNTFITQILSPNSVQISNSASADNVAVSLSVTTADNFTNGEIITTVEASPFSATLGVSAATGFGSTAHIQQGVYFIQGFFCLVSDQLLILDKYSNKPSYQIGLTVLSSFVNAADDPSLNSPAAGFYNFNAPGADRYKIDLIFSKLPLAVPASSNFVQLITIKDGVIQTQVTTPLYSELEKTLARRTLDTNGDFTVRYFPVEIKEHLDNGTNGGVYTASNGGLEDHIVYAVEPGKAYVKGFEINLQSTMLLSAPKARDTNVTNNYATSVNFGNSVDVTDLKYVFNVSGYDKVNLYSAVEEGSTILGTAYVRGISFISGTPGAMDSNGNSTAIYSLNLFNIVMNGSYLFANVKSISSTTTSASCNVILDINNNAVLSNVDASIGIIPLPAFAIKTLKPSGTGITNYIVNRYFTGTMIAGSITLTASTNEVFEGNSNFNYIVSIDTADIGGFTNGEIIEPTSITLVGSPHGKQVTIVKTGAGNATVKVIAAVNKTITTQKSKTLTTITQPTLSVDINDIVTLNKADIVKIVSIIDDTSAADITSHFTLDNGQRDNFYDVGKLTLSTLYAPPATTVSVTYQYFTHGSGDYFSVDSYTGAGIDYDSVPIYISNTNGQVYNLYSCLDFRPRIADAGISSGFSITSEFVSPVRDIIVDFEYYLPRIDKIFLDQDGKFQVILGKSATNPMPPLEPSNGMVLYTINVQPYTFSAKFVIPTLVDNRRYTMHDIGDLSQRISNLEYYTSLSLLEVNTAALFIADGSGNNSFKNGFIVDNFTSHLVGATGLVEYQCSMDTINGILRPQFSNRNVALIQDQTNSPSTWTLTSGGLITLPYTEISYIKQSLASNTENLNPYDIYNWVGSMTLSPSSDDWYDTTILPDIVAAGSSTAIASAANIKGQVSWDSWQTTWTGSPVVTSTTGHYVAVDSYTGLYAVNQAHAPGVSYTAYDGSGSIGWNPYGMRYINYTWVPGVTSSDYSNTTSTQTRTGILTTLTPTTTTQIIGTNMVDTGIVPYMRSVSISFTAKNLRPNDRVYPFFDNVNVSAYTNPTGGTQGSALITDANGTISGTFIVPDSASTGVMFRTGARVFKLIDDINNNSSNATTSTAAQFISAGILDTQQNTVLSTQVMTTVQTTVSQTQQLVGTNVQSIAGYMDPLAQSFLVEAPGGAFISKVNIYFSSKDDSIPVTLQLRNMINGYPGPNIIPFGTVSLNPSQVNISTDSSLETTFEFPSPVYLQDGQEYCFVLLANSDAYNVYIAQMGNQDFITGSNIVKQPYAGVMFKSQNSSTWTPAQEQDIKFEIFRCSFVTSTPADILFRNEDISTDILTIDPFYTTNSSKIVKVYQPYHGLATGLKTTIAGVIGVKNGIPAAELNGQQTVTVIDFDNYTFTVSTTNATSTGSTGSSEITATNNYQLDVANVNIQNINFPTTELSFAIKTTSIASVLDTAFSDIILNTNLNMSSSKSILSIDNEPAGQSLLIDATMTTTVENLSPIIDINRCSAIIVANRINNDDINETLAASGNAIARYITQQVTLSTQANSINVQFSAFRPFGSNIEVYIKMLPSDSETNFADEPYILIPSTDYPVYSNTTPADYTFELDNQTPFTIFSIKIVMLSVDTSNVPEIKSFRAIAVTK